jgi:DNA-binding GntR family transcriptional regulator
MIVVPPPSARRGYPELPRSKRAHVTIQSGIANALRNRIIDGTLSPDTQVTEELISREMGVSRGPVREALRELEKEGLLVVHPFRGAFVSKISKEELRDVLIPVRFILEQQALSRALPTMTDKDFEVLDNLTEQMRSVASSQDEGTLLALVELDVTYHEYMVGLGDQYHTLQLWRSIQPRIRTGMFQLGAHHLDLLEIAEEHKVLLMALRTRDLEVALDALGTHIYTTQYELMNRLDATSNGTHE